MAVRKLRQASAQFARLQATLVPTARLDQTMSALQQARDSVDDALRAATSNAGLAGQGGRGGGGVPGQSSGTAKAAVSLPAKQLDEIVQSVLGVRRQLGAARGQRRRDFESLDAMLRQVEAGVGLLREELDGLAVPELRAQRLVAWTEQQRQLEQERQQRQQQQRNRLSRPRPEQDVAGTPGPVRRRQVGAPWWHPPPVFHDDQDLVTCLTLDMWRDFGDEVSS
jgi:hypothetical protein